MTVRSLLVGFNNIDKFFTKEELDVKLCDGKYMSDTTKFREIKEYYLTELSKRIKNQNKDERRTAI